MIRDLCSARKLPTWLDRLQYFPKDTAQFGERPEIVVNSVYSFQWSFKKKKYIIHFFLPCHLQCQKRKKDIGASLELKLPLLETFGWMCILATCARFIKKGACKVLNGVCFFDLFGIFTSNLHWLVEQRLIQFSWKLFREVQDVFEVQAYRDCVARSEASAKKTESLISSLVTWLV